MNLVELTLMEGCTKAVYVDPVTRSFVLILRPINLIDVAIGDPSSADRRIVSQNL
jgi:hypothetical protein